LSIGTGSFFLLAIDLDIPKSFENLDRLKVIKHKLVELLLIFRVSQVVLIHELFE
jgi:hypothetical protein